MIRQPRLTLVGCVTVLLLAGTWVSAQTANTAVPAPPPAEHGALYSVLMYVPNRVLDLSDVFRLRLRVGPGLAAGARLTEALAPYGGHYRSVYVGLPGPRTRPEIASPLGLEARKDYELPLDADAAYARRFPAYQWDEIGLEAHPGIIGLAAGFSIYEFADLLCGFFGADFADDDL